MRDTYLRSFENQLELLPKKKTPSSSSSISFLDPFIGATRFRRKQKSFRPVVSGGGGREIAIALWGGKGEKSRTRWATKTIVISIGSIGL